ncbi:hypothetical protein FALCPG4_004210 [Fusarium falciforme]
MQAYIVQGLMLLYLKYRKDIDGFSQSQVNTLPIATHAIGIVAELSSSLAIDRYNQRLTIGFTLCAIQIICSIVLLIPNMSVPGNLTVLYLSSTSYGINPLLYSWSSNIVARTADDAARSVILASMAASDGLLWTFWGYCLVSGQRRSVLAQGVYCHDLYQHSSCKLAFRCSLARWVHSKKVLRGLF